MSNEALADILAEIRNDAAEDMAASPHDIYELADRIEAAAKRERKALHAELEQVKDQRNRAPAMERKRLVDNGFLIIRKENAVCNTAKMREALECIIENLEIHIKCGRCVAPGNHVSFPISEAQSYISQARAALAAPARNCDRFASFKEAFDTWCVEVNPKPNTPIAIFAIWLFAPAERGAE